MPRRAITSLVLTLAGVALAAPALAQTSAPPAPAPAALTPPAAATDRPAKIATTALAKGSGIAGHQLSPDGSKLAFTATSGGKVGIAVMTLPDRKVAEKIAIPEKNELEWVSWAGSNKLLISLSATTEFYGDEVKVTRLALYDLTTRVFSIVGKGDMGIEGDDVLFVDPAGAWLLLSMQRTIYDYPSVWRFPLDGSGGKHAVQIQPQKTFVWKWYTDDAGVVRMGLAFDENKVKVWYRPGPAAEFKQIAKLTEDTKEDEVWDMVRIINGSDEGYALKPDDSGHLALRKFNYATRTPGEVVFAVPGWDVDAYSLGTDNKPTAAWYTDDRRHIKWFDPKMAGLQTRLERAMKGSDVWITSHSDDYKRLMVWIGHEDDAGAYYIFDNTDPKQARLDVFNENRPELAVNLLATPKPIAYTARDKTPIKGYLTLPRGRAAKNLPLILLPHGGPYGIRDSLEFNAEVQLMANRGYAVLQPNFRGSGGYGDAFETLGDGQMGRAMQDDLDDAMDWAVAQGIADPKRVCVVGSSYGGYAALWAVIRNPERYRCAASFAGVTDLKKQLAYSSDFFRGKSRKKWQLRVKGEDKFDLATVSPAAQAARLTRPVLLAHGDADTTVPFKQFKLMRDAAAKAGKPIETLIFPEEGHGFDKDEDEAKWYDTLEAFLAKHNPAD